MYLLLSAILAGAVRVGRATTVPCGRAGRRVGRCTRESPVTGLVRMLVKPLPRTTGALLELDRLHRVDNPLGPVLAAKLRWIAADAIGCRLRTGVPAADDLRAPTARATTCAG